jgi:hypothetical protein
MPSSYKMTVKGLCVRCLSARGPEPPYILIRVYSILVHTGKGGGGELNHKEGESGRSSQSWVENTKMTDFISSL